ncbi:MAG: hypothetical protein ACLP4W_10730 [Mycobacterium sp.]|uniref:hypothetical protein n=1 Tax=Mycobacterium sp. TaxID=1785 RepID=UPI003F996995
MAPSATAAVDADGPAAEARVGRAIANDLVSGVEPDSESNYIRTNANSTITPTDADVIVHAAGVAYLGWVVTP